MKSLSSEQHFPIYKSGTQRQGTSKWMIRSGRNSNSSEILWLSCYLQVWRWFYQKGRHYPPNNIFSIISLWQTFFMAQGQVTQKRIVWSGWKSNSANILWLSSLPANLTKIQLKMKSLSSEQHFPRYNSMGPVGCHGNQSFYLICAKTLCSLSPTPLTLHIKFDQDWPTCLRDIQVWKCGRRTIGIL